MCQRKVEILWGISLLIISIVTLILVGSNIIGFQLPDIVIRILGILALISIPVLVYTSKSKKK